MKNLYPFKNLAYGRWLCAIFLILPNITFGQVLPANRSIDWTIAGLRGEQYNPCFVISINDYGADPTGLVASDNALLLAKNALMGNPGIIFIPAGDYLFNNPITLSTGQVIKGAGSHLTSIEFDLGGAGHCIQANGNYAGAIDTLLEGAEKGDHYLRTNNALSFEAGNYLRLHGDDADLVHDAWALGQVLHVVKITQISGDTLFLDQSLRHAYPMNRFPRIQRIVPVEHVGIENLKIKRLDATVSQFRNISFKRVVNSWIHGVESDQCNFGHIVLEMSAYCEISGCYMHHAFNYGGGGKAYGVVLQGGSNLNRIENNIFEHLRHSMLLQSGANGNVVGYNYSTDPFWTEFFSNAGGDIVLHGNYPFLNLFESNVAQNIRIDASHGENGPLNTFLRNRGELWGLIMSNNPASDDQNIIGSEITNNSFLLGNYTIAGSGHFTHGNNVRGTVNPAGTSTLPDTSYGYSSLPDFLASSPTWPFIGYPNTLNEETIPAEIRFDTGGLFITVPNLEYKIESDSLFWTGCSNSSDWYDPTNWSQLKIPEMNSDVVIQLPTNASNMFPEITIDTSIIHSLNIRPPAILRVVSPGHLEVKE